MSSKRRFWLKHIEAWRTTDLSQTEYARQHQLSIKSFVIGRKNWLFAQSVNGARASAVLYSLVETAKANGLEPYAWLRYVLAKLPQLPKGASVEQLLPMNLTSDDLKIVDWWQ